ncbi:hypothetical protein Vse01_36960 [Micromonospora sediminimaris]|uniref:Uncharacterized protein n=1 Tax=Micromonospora sediminimaris TaxID=547162 RepID=A0A9W5XM90_9ACTN|nr:hypothetical protein Vse01_36960 [Micromonospora sediminimaris]
MTVPLLPCPSIDDIVAFYQVLGFHPTYQQRKPNPYVALRPLSDSAEPACRAGRRTRGPAHPGDV